MSFFIFPLLSKVRHVLYIKIFVLDEVDGSNDMFDNHRHEKHLNMKAKKKFYLSTVSNPLCPSSLLDTILTFS
jgi:hypothetical protein